MKVKNLYVEYHIDYLKRQVHVLEKGRPVYHDNLPSNIGEEFQKNLIEQGCLLKDAIEFEWLCYCSNGLVLLFKDALKV
jgi:hypothetical protein